MRRRDFFFKCTLKLYFMVVWAINMDIVVEILFYINYSTSKKNKWIYFLYLAFRTEYNLVYLLWNKSLICDFITQKYQIYPHFFTQSFYSCFSYMSLKIYWRVLKFKFVHTVHFFIYLDHIKYSSQLVFSNVKKISII